MDNTAPTTAADILNTYSAADLARILFQYGEEKFARRIADRIVRERETEPFTNSARLSELVRDAIPQAARRTGGHPAKRTFQALRIEVNGELEVLRRALPAAIDGAGAARPDRGDELPLAGGPDHQADAGGRHQVRRARRPAGDSGRPRAVPQAADPWCRAADRGRGRGEPAGRLGRGSGRPSGSARRAWWPDEHSVQSVEGAGHARRRPARSEPKLRVVYGAPFRPPRMPFVIFVVSLLAAGLVGLLLLNTELQRGTFQVTALNQQADQLRDQQEQLERQVRTLESPQNLADRALRMGMVPNPNPVFLRLSDGRVLGVPEEGKAGTGTAMFGPGTPTVPRSSRRQSRSSRSRRRPRRSHRQTPPSRPATTAKPPATTTKPPATGTTASHRYGDGEQAARDHDARPHRPGDDRMTERRGNEPPRKRGGEPEPGQPAPQGPASPSVRYRQHPLHPAASRVAPASVSCGRPGRRPPAHRAGRKSAGSAAPRPACRGEARPSRAAQATSARQADWWCASSAGGSKPASARKSAGARQAGRPWQAAGAADRLTSSRRSGCAGCRARTVRPRKAAAGQRAAPAPYER